MRPELLSKVLNNNNNVGVHDSWSSAGGGGCGVDLSPLSLRSLASLLPLAASDDFAAIKYPDLPLLDSLVAGGYPAGSAGDVGLCGSSDSGHSGSGSSPPATASPAESAASPHRLPTACAAPPPPLGCLCFLCTEAAISAALVPCGHNLFCKECADAVVSKAEAAERRCPVCGEQASLAIRILS